MCVADLREQRIVLCENDAIVYITGEVGRGRYFIIDKDDYERTMQHRWWLIKKPNAEYIYTKIKDENGVRRTVNIHQFIVNSPGAPFDVDHIDRNSFNNRKSNLRIVTKTQNQGNRGKNKNGSSRFKGVSRVKAGYWRAQITINYKLVTIGYFESEIDAAKAYDVYASRYFGDCACLNFPDEIDESVLERTRKVDVTSKYPGICFDSRHGKWMVFFQANKKKHYVGRFKTEIEAVRAHDAYVIQNGLNRPLLLSHEVM